ncbi:Uma2 family endonuclease [Cohnella soli]|uniref:Uma2 family endonuclease n=1 Tax=Cohnella soli TaxID=425005 RepID=A0ABW0I1S9_9BACL
MTKNKKDDRVKEQQVTYDIYATIDDGHRYEVDEGKLELLSAPSPKHQVVGGYMLQLLMNSCQSDYIVFASPIDVILSATEVRQPDLVMVHRGNMGIVTRRGIEGIPDLVGEILSPHSVKRDKQRKLHVYAKYEIPEYWIIDPGNEALEQYMLANGKYELINLYERDDIVRSERLPCISFTMAQILETAAELPG